MTSIIVALVTSKTRSQWSRLTGSPRHLITCDLSRHCRTGSFYGLLCDRSKRCLSNVDCDTCYRRWLDSHKCSNSATIHGRQLSLWSCVSTAVENLGTSHERWFTYLQSSELSLTDFYSTKILARDSIIYFVSMTGTLHSSLYTIALSSIYNRYSNLQYYLFSRSPSSRS